MVNEFPTAPGLFLIHRLGPHYLQIRNVKERLNPIPIAIGTLFLIPILQSSLTAISYPSTPGLSGSMWPVLTGFCRLSEPGFIGWNGLAGV
jgi:hypothetical protein